MVTPQQPQRYDLAALAARQSGQAPVPDPVDVGQALRRALKQGAPVVEISALRPGATLPELRAFLVSLVQALEAAGVIQTSNQLDSLPAAEETP